MNSMSWYKLTVSQFLDLYKTSNSDLDEMEKSERAISIIYSLTPKEIDKMKMSEFQKLSKEAGVFLTSKIPGAAVPFIKVGSKKYQVIYDPTRLRQRQYVEIVHFATNPIENMHLIMASIVKPYRFGVAYPNDANKHEEYANDMLQARVVDVYHTCVFFCNLYRNLMAASLDYLERDGVTKKMRETIMSLISVMDGYMPQRELQSMNG